MRLSSKKNTNPTLTLPTSQTLNFSYFFLPSEKRKKRKKKLSSSPSTQLTSITAPASEGSLAKSAASSLQLETHLALSSRIVVSYEMWSSRTT